MNRLRIIWLLIGIMVGVAFAQLAPIAPPPPADLAEMSQRINALAKNGAEIRLSKHAKERMEQRNFTLDDIRVVLQNGAIKTPPRMGKQGDYSYKMEDDDTNGTKDGEVVVVPEENSLFIVTVMWDGENS